MLNGQLDLFYFEYQMIIKNVLQFGAVRCTLYIILVFYATISIGAMHLNNSVKQVHSTNTCCSIEIKSVLRYSVLACPRENGEHQSIDYQG